MPLSQSTVPASGSFSAITAIRTHRLLFPVVFALIAAVFVVQVAIPAGWALNALYIGPVAIAVLYSSFRHSFFVSLVAVSVTVLATIMFFGSPFWDSPLNMTTMYLLPVAAIWVMAILSVIRKAREKAVILAKKARLMCITCRQISDQSGSWSLEEYMDKHPSSTVSLYRCETCREKFRNGYPKRA